jgi:adenylate cyclase, class 2
MSASVEREIKLRFDSAAAARSAVAAAGATPLRPRRLQRDVLLDDASGRLRQLRSALRVRQEDGRTLLTFKGPVDTAQRLVKQREENETAVADGAVLLRVLDALGLAVWFRSEKYREEFSWREVVIAIDETPIGTFVELEGSEAQIVACSGALGRSTGEFILDSYRGLFVRHCTTNGSPVTDMVFGDA